MGRRGGPSLRSEILLLCSLSILMVSVVSGALAYHLLESRLLNQAIADQRSIANQRASLISAYLDDQSNHLIDISQSQTAATSLRTLDDAYAKGVSSAAYTEQDKLNKPHFEAFIDRWHFYDLFLINNRGDVVFTVAHESDFATNLNSGPWRESALADVFRESLQSLSPHQSEFKYYPPSLQPAAFMAVPVVYDHQLWGVIAIQLDTDAFYDVARNLEGLGQSGEIVLGTRSIDGVMVTAPLRGDPDAAFNRIILEESGLGRPILDATRGESGQGAFKDWRGIDVIAAWTFIPGLNWGIVAKIDRSEAMAGLLDIRNGLIAGLLAITLLTLIGVALYTRRITRPLHELTSMAAAMAAGRLDAYPDNVTTGSREITLLSSTFQHMAGQILQHQRGLEDEIRARTADLRRLQAAIEHSDNIVMITNRDAIVEYVNPAFERISGYTSAYAIGRPASVVKSGEMDISFYRDMWDTILAGQNWNSLFINRNRAGDLYEVEQVISPISNDDGEITGFVSVQRDVTHERAERQQMEHAQRLESLGVLAGGIAYDFNNLLTAIMGNAGLARAEMDTDSTLATRLDNIEKASQRAADLCKQMLAYSGKGRFVVEAINISQLVREMTELLQVSIAKHVTLQSDLPDDIPLIDADRSQMQQIIMNLIINASEAIAPPHGLIRIRTGTIEATPAYLASTYLDEQLPADNYVFIEVSDDGSGMDAATKAKLFDPFFTTKFTGRGLGMSAILGIVRGHRGAIKVYSEPGKGSTFKVLLPYSRGTRKTVSAEVVKTTSTHAGGLILIVDDEAMVRNAAAQMLKQSGYDVITAENGLLGVEAFKTMHSQIRAVLLDMTMPVMDGKEAFREMRRIQPDVKVILSSGYNELDTTSRFAGKGLAGFIQKPYLIETLRTTLQRALNS